MERPEALKLLLELTKKNEYKALCFWANEEIDRLHKQLEVGKEQFELAKVQGCIKTLRQILQLEKEVINL